LEVTGNSTLNNIFVGFTSDTDGVPLVPSPTRR
jgi:hypothetical protein